MPWLTPFGARLLRNPLIATLTPAVRVFGGVQRLLDKHERSLHSQRNFARIQKETMTLLDDTRSSALRAIRMLQYSRRWTPAQTDSALSISSPSEEPPAEDPALKLVQWVEWIVCQLQGRNREFILTQASLREAEQFKENAEGKTDKEILILAQRVVMRERKRKEASSKNDRRGCECVSF